MAIDDALARIQQIQARFGVGATNRQAEFSTFSEVLSGADRHGGLDPREFAISAITGGPLSTGELAALLRVDQTAAGLLERIGADRLVMHPLAGREIASGFGVRADPFTGEQRAHQGIDVDADFGTPIRAMTSGSVTFAGEQGGYGNLVVIDHGGGWETRYAHEEMVLVSVGDEVRPGDVIGTVGSTGRSTGPHLHFEIRKDGQAVDPTPYLRGERLS